MKVANSDMISFLVHAFHLLHVFALLVFHFNVNLRSKVRVVSDANLFFMPCSLYISRNWY